MRKKTKEDRAGELYLIAKKDSQALAKQYEKAKGHGAPCGLGVHQMVQAILEKERKAA